MLKGKGISDGIGLGTVVILEKQEMKSKKIRVKDVAAEKEIFYEALHSVEREIKELINQLSGTEKEIMKAYFMILQDPTLVQETIKIIEQEKCNASYATEKGFNAIIQMFQEIEDPYMAERSLDIEDMKKKILAKILHKEEINVSKLPKNTILVAEELSTSDTAKLDLKNIAGILTTVGGVNSHMAIMARIHEIPAIVGVHQIMEKIKENDFIAINGTTGEIFINPSKEEHEKLEKMQEEIREEKKKLENYKQQKSTTKDGHNVKLLANIGGTQDIELVLKNTAEGIRTI